MAASAALAIILGADVGSALVAQLLLARHDWMVPLLLVVGVSLFTQGERRSVRQSGRILIGLALIFVSLSMIRDATEPLGNSTGMAAAMRYLGNDPYTSFAIGALFAWAVHSSVAAVLLVVTLASNGVLPLPAAVAMVFGVNLGGAFIAFILTLGSAIGARKVIIANLVVRGGGAVLALLLVTAPPDILGSTPGQQVINLHLAFNLLLAVLALPLTKPLLTLLDKLVVPHNGTTAELARVSALDPAALAKPDQALACATREVLRLGEETEIMLRSIIGLYDSWDDATATALRDKDKEVDRMHFETKIYLARLLRGQVDDETARRSMELSSISANLEAAADAIARNMLGLAKRLNARGLAFSDQGWREICDFHDQVLSNAQSALNVLMTLDPDAARSLVEEKQRVRVEEQKLQSAHIDRLRLGRKESIETSNIHQETLRELKQVNTAFSMIAYPIVAETGDLLGSRLRDQDDDEGLD